MNTYKNHKSLIFPYFILFFLYILFGLSSRPVQAVDLQLGISPPVLKVLIKPGKSITQVFNIHNLSAIDQTLIARLVTFSKADQYGNPILDPETQPGWLKYFSLANSNIQLNSPFLLKGNSSQQIILNLAVPDDAPLKDLYATLLVSVYDTNTTKVSGASIKASIASNLLVTVNTTATPENLLRIVKLSPDSKTYLKIGNTYYMDNMTPTNFTVVAQNDGKFASEVRGVFRVQSTQKMNLTQQNILNQYVIAQSQRRLQNTDQQIFPFTPNLNQVGRYSAQVEIDNGTANVTSQIKIVLLPLKALFGLAVGLILLLTVLNSAFRRSFAE